VALDQVISLASGPLRLQDVRDFLGVADRNSLFHMVEHIRDRNTTALLEIVRDLVERGRDLERYVKQVLAFLRDLLILRCGGSDELVRLSAEGIGKARALANSVDTAVLVNAVNQFLDLEARMKQGTTPRFLLEFTFLRLTALEDVAAIGELLQRLESGGGGGAAAASGRPARGVSASPAPAPDVHRSAEAAPAVSNSIPLTGGGSLERVDTQDIHQLREMLVKAVRDTDMALGMSLQTVPLSRIENNVAYFGVGQEIKGYDLRRLEKPESRSVLTEVLKQLTGSDNITIRFGGELKGFVSRQQARVVPREELAPVAAPLPAEESKPEPAPPVVPVSEEGDEPVDGYMDYQIAIEEARRAFGRKGMSAARIASLLREDETLREKVALVQKMFGAVVLDGDGRPVKLG